MLKAPGIIDRIFHKLDELRINYYFSRLMAAADVRGLPSRIRINHQCRGYSSASHWRFFRWVIGKYQPRSLCICGVYFGRDTAYLSHFMRQCSATSPYKIVAVDKFEDKFCEDWSEQVRHLNWQEAGFGPAPTMEQTRKNLEALQLTDSVELIAARAEDYLEKTPLLFDFIYVDTSHDYETTLKTIRLAQKRLNPGGIMAGDDYVDGGTWGVRSAVRAAFTTHEVFDSWIWVAKAADYRVEGPISRNHRE